MNATKYDKMLDVGETRCDSMHRISKSVSCHCASLCIKLPRKMCKMLHKLVEKMCRGRRYLLGKV